MVKETESYKRNVKYGVLGFILSSVLLYYCYLQVLPGNVHIRPGQFTEHATHNKNRGNGRKTYQRLVPQVASSKDFQQQRCNIYKNVVYVKTHKTASSSIQDILANFISFGASSFPNPYLGGYPGYFNREFLIARKKEHNGSLPTVKSMGGHMRYHRKTIEESTSSACKYITVIRNPLSQFQSSFNYYYGRFSKFESRFYKASCFPEPYLQVTGKMGVNLSTYLDLASKRLNNSMAWFFRSKNYQSFDLGMDPDIEDEKEILQYVKKLESEFSLVMISDYFLESLVLLKDELCAEWKDIRFKTLQEGKYERRSYTEKEKRQIRELNKQDFILYNHFNHTFWKRVQAYGEERMQRDVNRLRSQMQNENEDRVIDENKAEDKINLRTKRDNLKTDAKIMHFKKLTRRERIVNLSSRILAKYPDGNRQFVQKLAEYMNDNYGWCPH